MRRGLTNLLWLGVLALAVVTVGGYFGDLSWLLELPSHFRPHLAALSVAWLFFALFRRRMAAVSVCAVLIVANVLPLAPYISPARPAVATQVGVPLRVMTFNMHGRGTHPQALIDFVRAQKPDIVLLTETPGSYKWLTEYLGPDFHHRIVGPASGVANDVIVLSRWPIKNVEIDRSAARWLPVIAADICAPSARTNAGGSANENVSGPCIRLVGLHSTKGLRQHFAEMQKIQFDRAAHFAKTTDHPVVLAGDLNATPWSSIFEHLTESSGLVDTALGRGLTATWASRQPMIGLVIDHVLTSRDIVTRDYLVGDELGSDHLPVVADLILPQPKS
jgi:endonuclease/exonuclease/phosphatase (EEP) superfamily protein YafD